MSNFFKHWLSLFFTKRCFKGWFVKAYKKHHVRNWKIVTSKRVASKILSRFIFVSVCYPLMLRVAKGLYSTLKSEKPGYLCADKIDVHITLSAFLHCFPRQFPYSRIWAFEGRGVGSQLEGSRSQTNKWYLCIQLCWIHLNQLLNEAFQRVDQIHLKCYIELSRRREKQGDKRKGGRGGNPKIISYSLKERWDLDR